MKAGPRNTKIIIESSAAIENAMGARTKTWAKRLDAWASVNYGTGAERRVGGQEQATQVATFGILYSSQAARISTGDRLRISGDEANWDIVGAVPYGLNEGIHITANKIAK